MILLKNAEIYFNFIIGALCYWAIELLYRGFTHWTMPITGGFCFIIIYAIANFSPETLWQKWIMSASCICTIEFLVGALVNIVLGWSVWDYSALPYNLLGQICVQFSVYWLVLSIPAVFLCNIIRYFVFIPLYSRGKHSI